MLCLDGQVVKAAVTFRYMQIQNALVVEMLPAGAHQYRQAEVTRHGVQYKSCHRGEILVTNLTLFHEIHSFHWTVSDLLAVVNMLKTIRADLSAVQADEVQSPPGVHVLFNLGQVIPHPTRNQNRKPRSVSLKPNVKVIQCFYPWKC